MSSRNLLLSLQIFPILMFSLLNFPRQLVTQQILSTLVSQSELCSLCKNFEVPSYRMSFSANSNVRNTLSLAPILQSFYDILIITVNEQDYGRVGPLVPPLYTPLKCCEFHIYFIRSLKFLQQEKTSVFHFDRIQKVNMKWGTFPKLG